MDNFLDKIIKIIENNKNKKLSVDQVIDIFGCLIDILEEKKVIKEEMADLILMTYITALAQAIDEENFDKEVDEYLDLNKNLYEELLRNNLS